MYPPTVSPHTQSDAERRLFTEFSRQLPDEYTVMHGVGWLTRLRRRDEVGEADFVIVHPRRGVIVLEVKGGRIDGAWSSDDWVSTDRNGVRHGIRNPIRQAERSMWALKDKLDDNPPTRRFRYPLYRGVAFPDMLLQGASFGADWDRSLVIDSSDLPRLDLAVERMYSVDPPEPSFAREAVAGLVDMLQPRVQIDRRGLAAEMLDGDDAIMKLTQQQFQILSFLQHQRQVVINGCAGSGKTMLAIEKAIQLGAQGFAVLLTCYNKNLAAWMRSVVARQADEVAARIVVNHYHDLAVKLCDEAGMPTSVRPNDQSYWEEGISDDLSRAIPHLERRFDAIIADEGQDFAASWWITLQELLQDPAGGVFFIFQDEFQAIYRRDRDLPFATAPYTLLTNCRSTASIHRRLVEYYERHPGPVSFGPEGRDIEHIAYDGQPEREKIRKVVSRLVNDEGLRPSQIVVLTPNSAAKSALDENAALGNLRLTWGIEPGANQVRVSSIHGFKGLESDVVILAETSRFADSRTGRRLAYVALSRARHHLVVIGNLPDLPGTIDLPAPAAR